MSFLPANDAAYLKEKGIVYDDVVEGNQKGIIIRSYCLPLARFDVSQADVLILIPAGYPDLGPDMFYLLPWVRLAVVKKYPKAADVAFTFSGQSWQRWSRHNSEWRPNVDGIWTMLKRIETALEVAAA